MSFSVKHISLFLFCLWATLPAFAQTQSNYIHGKVLGENDELLAFASIQFKGTLFGTITNEDGEFVIDKRKLESDTIVVHFMGYKTREFVLNYKTDQQIVTLEKAVSQLSEVLVVGNEESYAYGLLKRLIRKYRGNNKEQISKAFLSLSSEIDQPLEIFEAFYNARLNPQMGVTNLELKNGRAGLVAKDNFSFVSLNTTDILCDFSPFLKTSEQKLPLIPTNMGNKAMKSIFDFRIDYILGSDEDQTAVVAFKPKNDAGLYFSGKYYIDIKGNSLQKLSLQISNTTKKFLESIQGGVTIDSLDISLVLNYLPGSTYLESMIYNYSFSLSNKPENIISSIALLAFYDYDAPFEMPVSKPVDLDFDYHRILSYPFNDAFWENNYYIPASKTKTDFTNFFKTNGYLINHDSVTEQSPYVESPYLCWDAEKRLQWSDIPTEKPVQKIVDIDGYISIEYISDENHYLKGHIFLDYEKQNDSTCYFSRASIDRSTSYMDDLPRNLKVLLYLNMYFDLYEIHRRNLLAALKKLSNPTRREITKVYDEQMKDLYDDLERLKKETQQGFNKESLTNWNNQINDLLGVNNLEVFGISEEEMGNW